MAGYECFRCTQLSEYCAEFISPRPNEVQTTESLCYCGHFLSQHSQTRQTASRTLPLKGGCALNGCTKFTSNGRESVTPKSICQCGMSWLAHSSEISLSNQVDVIPGQAFQPQFNTWQPPEAPNHTVSTNGRRVIAYTNHRPTPLASSSTSRIISNQAVTNNRTSRRAGIPNSSDSAHVFRFDIAVLCHPLAGADRDDDEVYLRKIWISKLPQLIERLRNNCLFINIDTSARPTDNATEFLNNSIMQHLTAHNITIPSSTDPLITRANQPELQANFYRIPWQLVKIGYSKSNSHGPSHTLTASDIPYHDMTWHKLISNQAGTRKELHRLPNPINNCSIIFICPAFGKLAGPILPGSTQEHPCFASRITNGLFSGLLNESLTEKPPYCFDSCPTLAHTPRPPSSDGMVSPQPSLSNLSYSPNLGPSPLLFLRSPSPVQLDPPSASHGLEGPSDFESPIAPSLTSQPIFIELEHWRDVIDSNLKESDDDEEFFMTADDIDGASQALLEFLIAQHSGKLLSRPRQTELHVNIPKHSSIAGLFFSRSVTFFVGRGCGEGVIRAVICQAIQKMISDEKYWRYRLDEVYSSLVPRDETSPTRCMQIKCYATLVMIALFYGVTPDPVSPFLLASILEEGHALLYDKEFLNAMAPATARLISHWPEDDTQLPPSNNEICLILSHVNLEYRDIVDYTPAQLKKLKGRVIHEILIGTLEKSEIDAFREGLSLRISNTIPNIALTLQHSIKPLFLQLYTRRVKDAKQVLDLIKIQKLGDGETLPSNENSEDNVLYDNSHVNTLGERFILHCRRYLHGRGHPDHPIYNDLISIANRNAANVEPAFRARQFLSCMSSLPFLPLNEQTLEIRFVRGPANQHTRPATAPNDWKMPPLPLYFHTCMYYADLPITMGLVDLLNAPVPDDTSTISDFDLWLHQSIFPINHIVTDGAETFNQA